MSVEKTFATYPIEHDAKAHLFLHKIGAFCEKNHQWRVNVFILLVNERHFRELNQLAAGSSLDLVDLFKIALGGGGLEKLAFFFVIGDRFEGDIHVLKTGWVALDALVDQAHPRVERDPFELLHEHLRPDSRVKDQRILNR